MLLYHPAFDIYHAAFRLLRLLDKLPRSPHDLERIRILDFYLLFPNQIGDIKLPKEAIRFRKLLESPETPYAAIQDPRRIFSELEAYQMTALKLLASANLIDIRGLAEGKISRTDQPIPQKLSAAMNSSNDRSADLIELLAGPLSNIDLYGKSGLKARTDLFEYRYDPA